MYFQDPRTLLQIYAQLEEQNLFLIQNAQESEEALEELRAKFRCLFSQGSPTTNYHVGTDTDYRCFLLSLSSSLGLFQQAPHPPPLRLCMIAELHVEICFQDHVKEKQCRLCSCR